MVGLFWRLLHRYGPEWAIHLVCSLCREEGICPKCIIDWEKVEAVEVTGPPGWGASNTSTAGAQTTTWTYTATTGFLRSVE